jgi:hypothetical protein
VISKELPHSVYSDLCGQVSHAYQTSYTDPETQAIVTIDSETNGGFPSFMTLNESPELNPAEENRTYSSVFNEKLSVSALDSSFCWIP